MSTLQKVREVEENAYLQYGVLLKGVLVAGGGGGGRLREINPFNQRPLVWTLFLKTPINGHFWSSWHGMYIWDNK